jgi:hypothetical protein
MGSDIDNENQIYHTGLNPWRRVFPRKQLSVQLDNTFPAYERNRILILFLRKPGSKA